MKPRLAAPVCALLGVIVMALAACGAPKYAKYSSIHGDWRCRVPWGWNVVTDDDGTRTTATIFLGPFEPDFALGLPSLQVRWYTYGVPHQLRNGTAELYSSADDYIRQMLDVVYGKDREMDQDLRDIELSDGRKAKNFVVTSGVAAPRGAEFGLSKDPTTGRQWIVRKHAYVVVPMKRGFYVLIYPATLGGFKLYEHQFYELVNSFVPSTDGPGGPPAAPAVAFASKGKP